MTSIAVIRWRHDQKIPLVFPVFVFWPILIVLLVIGWSMQLGTSRWKLRGKYIVLMTRLINGMRGLRVSLRDDDSFLTIIVL